MSRAPISSENSASMSRGASKNLCKISKTAVCSRRTTGLCFSIATGCSRSTGCYTTSFCPSTGRPAMPELIDTLSAVDLLYPLNEFYSEAGLVLPSATRINGREMPEPYQRLLVHDRDMTPTFEAAYDRRMNLRVLKYALDHEVFSRQIVLVPEGTETPVVFGAIKIYLDEFSTAARDLVLECKPASGHDPRIAGDQTFQQTRRVFRGRARCNHLPGFGNRRARPALRPPQCAGQQHRPQVSAGFRDSST